MMMTPIGLVYCCPYPVLSAYPAIQRTIQYTTVITAGADPEIEEGGGIHVSGDCFGARSTQLSEPAYIVAPFLGLRVCVRRLQYQYVVQKPMYIQHAQSCRGHATPCRNLDRVRVILRLSVMTTIFWQLECNSSYCHFL